MQCDEEYIPKVIMIYVDENLPKGGKQKYELQSGAQLMFNKAKRL